MTTFNSKVRGRPPKYDWVLQMKVGDTRNVRNLGHGTDKQRYHRVYMALRYWRPRLGNRRFRIEIGTVGKDSHRVARITRVQ